MGFGIVEVLVCVGVEVMVFELVEVLIIVGCNCIVKLLEWVVSVGKVIECECDCVFGLLIFIIDFNDLFDR